MALNGRIESGLMKVNADVDVKISAGDQYLITIGYHSGNSRITAKTLAELTDATATNSDIIADYTGYVNGNIVTGVMPRRDAYSNYLSASLDGVDITTYFSRGAYIDLSDNGNPVIQVPQDVIASLANLKPELLAKNKTFLGVTGVYTSDATATEDDLALGYTGYRNGELIVGKLQPTIIYNIGVVSNGYTSIIVSWNNPTNGPYEGVRLWISTTQNLNIEGVTPTYKGSGSNTSPNGRSSVIIEDLEPGTQYYVVAVPYCGVLESNTRFDIQIMTPAVPYVSSRMKPVAELRNIFNSSMIHFTQSSNAPGAEIVPSDLTTDDNGSVLTWYDISTNTQYWYSTADVLDMVECAGLFEGYTNLESVQMENIDISKVGSMDSMFKGCMKLKTVSMSSETPLLTSMESMFYNCQQLLEVPNLNTSNVQSFKYAFYYCQHIKLVPAFDVSNVESFAYAYSNCTELQSVPVNTQKAMTFEYAFENCTSLTSLPSINTSNAKYFLNTFSNCTGLREITLDYDFSNALSTKWMFMGCTSLTSVTINVQSSLLQNTNSMFRNCVNLTSITFTSFNTSSVTDINSMFYQCRKLMSLNLSSFNTSKVTDYKYMLGECALLTSVNYGDNFILSDDFKASPYSMADSESNGTRGFVINCPANKPNWTGGSWVAGGTYVLSSTP